MDQNHGLIPSCSHCFVVGKVGTSEPYIAKPNLFFNKNQTNMVILRKTKNFYIDINSWLDYGQDISAVVHRTNHVIN